MLLLPSPKLNTQFVAFATRHSNWTASGAVPGCGVVEYLGSALGAEGFTCSPPEPVDSSSNTQSPSPAALFPGVVKLWVPVLANGEPVMAENVPALGRLLPRRKARHRKGRHRQGRSARRDGRSNGRIGCRALQVWAAAVTSQPSASSPPPPAAQPAVGLTGAGARRRR